MQIAEVMITSAYPHLACHESLKFNHYLVNVKINEQTFQD